jgi:hypothetical protein
MVNSTEQRIFLNDVPKHLGRDGLRIHTSTIVRWITRGLAVGGGQRLYLEATRVGGRWATSIEALERFEKRRNESNPVRMDLPRPSSETNRSSERAGELLESVGI